MFNSTSLWLIELLTLACLAVPAFAQNKIPQFKDYPADEPYYGPIPALKFGETDEFFQAKLKEAAKGKPNFAGHYILATWGCGTECVMGAAIDAKTGEVYGLPHTICCWGFDVDDKFKAVEFRLESRLIVLSGLRDEKEGDNGAHFYKFENGKFIHIRSISKRTGSKE